MPGQYQEQEPPRRVRPPRSKAEQEEPGEPAVDALTLLRSPERLTREVVSVARGLYTSDALLEVDQLIGVADVLGEVRAFEMQQYVLEQYQLPSLVLPRSSAIPIPTLTSIVTANDVIEQGANSRSALGAELRRVQKQASVLQPVRETDHASARDACYKRLSSFLSSRRASALASFDDSTKSDGSVASVWNKMRTRVGMRASRKPTPPPTSATFEVRCQEPGLHVYKSMAFLARVARTRDLFGGRMTSPVSGVLEYGIWVFATAQGNQPEVWEPHEVSVPHNMSVDLHGALHI